MAYWFVELIVSVNQECNRLNSVYKRISLHACIYSLCYLANYTYDWGRIHITGENILGFFFL